MSKLGNEVAALLGKVSHLTVYELSEHLNRPPKSVKTMIVDMKRSGYLETANKGEYPARYKLTGKRGPVVIDWKPRAPKYIPPSTMVQMTIRSTPNSVFALGAHV